MKEKLVITKKNPRGVDGYKIFSIRIRDDTLDRSNAISDNSGRTRNELIGMLLEYALDNCEVKEP